MSCLAPAARIPSMAAWSFLRTSSVGWSNNPSQNFQLPRENAAYHVMRFVIDSENDFGIVEESLRKFMPKFLKLLGGGSCGV